MPSAELPPVFVLAAGLGTRLGFSSAKTLFPVAGRPMLDWILLECERQQVSRVTVTVLRQHERAIREFCESRALDGIQLSVSVDETPQGTLGTLRNAWSGDRSQRLLVWLGDVVGRPPLLALDQAAREAPAVLLAHYRQDYQDSGVITVAAGPAGQSASRQVTGFLEKPGRLDVPQARVWAGVAAIQARVLTDCPGRDLGRDLWPPLVAAASCRVIDSDQAEPLMAVDRPQDCARLSGRLRMAETR
jgi:NDP-sugar pyrophosphorylase family protein